MVRRVTHNFRRAPDSLHEARTFVGVVLKAWGIPDLAEPATLVTSELATEAMRRGGAGYRVTVEWDQPEVRIEVVERPSEGPALIDPS